MGWRDEAIKLFIGCSMRCAVFHQLSAGMIATASNRRIFKASYQCCKIESFLVCSRTGSGIINS